MKALITAWLTLMALADPASAQQAQYCDWIARADGIVEPWEEHIRSFANGEVRLALLDVIEPAAGALHLLILSPPHNEMGERQCVTLGLSESIGFSAVYFAALDAAYDPTVGLVFDVPVEVSDGMGATQAYDLRFTLNQSSGAIAAELQ
jgi:hypothetical protein